MVVRMKVKHEEFKRLRTTNEAMLLSEGDRAGPLRREFQRVHIAQVKQAFATEGATTLGGKWRAWSPSYAAWRRKHRSKWGRKMMVLTGTMKWKFTKPSHQAFISVWKKPWTFHFGAYDEVAHLHQEGIGALPRRSVIDKTSANIEQFRKTLDAFWKKRRDQVLRHQR